MPIGPPWIHSSSGSLPVAFLGLTRKPWIGVPSVDSTLTAFDLGPVSDREARQARERPRRAVGCRVEHVALERVAQRRADGRDAAVGQCRGLAVRTAGAARGDALDLAARGIDRADRRQAVVVGGDEQALAIGRSSRRGAASDPSRLASARSVPLAMSISVSVGRTTSLRRAGAANRRRACGRRARASASRCWCWRRRRTPGTRRWRHR